MTIYQKLAKVKASIGAITKDSTNPFFKSKYFDINSLLLQLEPLLDEQGLLLLQPIEDGKLYTRIVDCESEKMVVSSMPLPDLSDPQKLGGVITYYRRYSLQSLLSLQAEDDDGNHAAGRKVASTQSIVPAKPGKTKEVLTDLQFELTKKAPVNQIENVLKNYTMSTERRAELTNLVNKQS